MSRSQIIQEVWRLKGLIEGFQEKLVPVLDKIANFFSPDDSPALYDDEHRENWLKVNAEKLKLESDIRINESKVTELQSRLA